MNRLLPPNTTAIERAVEKTFLPASLNVAVDTVSRPYETPTKFLPFVAWQTSISDEEGWNLSESEDSQRGLIDGYFVIHAKKGTVSSIRETFNRLGFGDIQILENIGRLRRDGMFNYDNQMIHGGDHSSTWATYHIKLLFPATNDQALLIRRLLDGIAPARSELVNLDYRFVAHRHNGLIERNSQFNYGSA